MCEHITHQTKVFETKKSLTFVKLFLFFSIEVR